MSKITLCDFVGCTSQCRMPSGIRIGVDRRLAFCAKHVSIMADIYIRFKRRECAANIEQILGSNVPIDTFLRHHQITWLTAIITDRKKFSDNLSLSARRAAKGHNGWVIKLARALSLRLKMNEIQSSLQIASPLSSHQISRGGVPQIRWGNYI